MRHWRCTSAVWHWQKSVLKCSTAPSYASKSSRRVQTKSRRTKRLNCSTKRKRNREESGKRDSEFGKRKAGFGIRKAGFGIRKAEFGICIRLYGRFAEEPRFASVADRLGHCANFKIFH